MVVQFHDYSYQGGNYDLMLTDSNNIYIPVILSMWISNTAIENKHKPKLSIKESHAE